MELLKSSNLSIATKITPKMGLFFFGKPYTIDWTTLTKTWFAGSLANTTTETTVGSITLPAGTWLLNLTGQIDSGGQTGTKYLQIKSGSSVYADCRLWGGNLAITLSNTRVVSLTAKTTLNIVTYGETSGSYWYNSALIAQRIG